MKRLKLNLVMVAAIAIAAVTMSFKAVEKTKASTDAIESVFILNPGGTPTNPSHYTYSLAGTSCEEGDDICAVSIGDDAVLTEEELEAVLSEMEGKIYWRE